MAGLVDMFKIGENNTHVGVIQYSYDNVPTAPDFNCHCIAQNDSIERITLDESKDMTKAALKQVACTVGHNHRAALTI